MTTEFRTPPHNIEAEKSLLGAIFREEYYLERTQPSHRPDEKDDRFAEKMERWERRREEVRNIAEVIIAKQRHGPIGTVKMMFQGEFTRFGDLESRH